MMHFASSRRFLSHFAHILHLKISVFTDANFALEKSFN